jgi:hypothetical protein
MYCQIHRVLDISGDAFLRFWGKFVMLPRILTWAINLALSTCMFLVLLGLHALLSSDTMCSFTQVGTPLCVPQKEYIDIGRIASIEFNKKSVDYAKKGQKVAIKVRYIIVD